MQQTRLGEILVGRGILSAEQLALARLAQERTGQRLGHVLIDAGIVDEESIVRALAFQFGLRYVDLTLDMVDPGFTRMIDSASALRLRALPVSESGGLLRVAIADPSDRPGLAELERLLGRQVEFVVVAESRLSAIRRALEAPADVITELRQKLDLLAQP